MTDVVRWPTPYGFTIFCDDIRFEQNGKRSLIGVYTGELIVFGSPPVALPQFAMVVNYFERPGESTEPVEIGILASWRPEPLFKIILPVDEMRKIPLPSDPEADDPVIGGVWNLNIPNLQLPQPGRIKVRARRGESEVRLGSLLVSFRPPATDNSTQS